MLVFFTLVACNRQPSTNATATKVIPHKAIKAFRNNGNTIKGIATAAHGASEFEVWRTSVKSGGSTPLHTHDSEETFIFLKGEGKAIIGGKTIHFSAPSTLIAPANIPHQYFNTGKEDSDAIVVIKIGSKIFNHEHKEMHLPWR